MLDLVLRSRHLNEPVHREAFLGEMHAKPVFLRLISGGGFTSGFRKAIVSLTRQCRWLTRWRAHAQRRRLVAC